MKQLVLLWPRNRLILSRYSSTSFGNRIQRERDEGRLGGQNLSERYVRLAKSLKGKGAFIEGFNIPSTSTDPAHGTTVLKSRPGNSFHGFDIPEPPQEPSSEDCCMSGCAVCVYDLYEESLVQYRESLENIRSSLIKLGVPQREWPTSLSSKGTKLGLNRAANASESAFEALERALASKAATSVR